MPEQTDSDQKLLDSLERSYFTETQQMVRNEMRGQVSPEKLADSQEKANQMKSRITELKNKKAYIESVTM